MRKEALVPLTGIAFLVIVIVGFAVGGEPPDAGSGADEIVDFYLDNKDSVQFGAVLTALAGVLLVFFTNHLRRLFAEAGSATVSATVLVGGAIVAIGAAFDATLIFATAEAAEDIEPASVQTLQALWDNDWIPIAMGVLVFLISVGIATLRTGALPVWLGWVALALAVVGLTPIGFAAFLGAALWIAVVSILLALRGRAPATPASPQTSA
jgi:hypothetical protein